jgi:hypothetical protein
MEAHTLRLDMQPALKTPEIRRTCCAVEAILRAGDILDTEPPAVLEEIRDYCTAYNKGGKARSARSSTWNDLVVEHLADARLRSSGSTAA